MFCSCPYTVDGVHEPNVILKDNDLKYKIRLPLPTAAQVLRQLCLDADFFCSLGIMDYSLLGINFDETIISPALSSNNHVHV